MGKISIGEYHAKITAGGEQAITELNRVDNAFRRGASRVEAEVGKMADSVRKKFSTADIGKDILKGFGVGSGFAVAQTAVEKVTDHYREQAEFAKQIEENTAKTLASTQRMIALRQTDDQKSVVAQREFERKGQELAAARGINRKTSEARFSRSGAFQGIVESERPFSAEELAKIQELTRQYQELGEAVDKLRVTREKEKTAAAEKDATSDQTRRIRALTEGVRQNEEAYEALIATQKKKNEQTAKDRQETEQLTEKYLRIADPLRSFKMDIAEVNQLISAGNPEWRQLGVAIGNIREKMVDVALKDFFGDMDKVAGQTRDTTEFAKDLGLTFSSAFEDAIVGGQKLGDVLRGLAQDVLRLFVRQTITTPAANFLAGMFSSFGGGKADGGPVSGGTPYMVGERGPELFVPSRSGTIVPNHEMGGGGSTFIFSPQISAGVTRQELAGMLPAMFDQFVAKVGDRASRGGTYRKAFA